ncbi:MAG: phosphoglucosamine mutase [Actinobacteria bacterium]|nr:phosphoglucosamine mutase [Actinomycetota bacterium]
MTLRFGTDGVRGVANAELTPELALRLGRAAARVLGGDRWLIGRDPRRSGPMLLGALAAGLASEGADAVDLGVVPTPGVAHASVVEGLGAAVISASHNPFADNGIKLFLPGGRKLRDDEEEALEADLDRLAAEPGGAGRPTGARVGTVMADHRPVDRYADHLATVPLGGRRLDGVSVVIDCANGAASEIAPEVLRALGASVAVLHADPDGTNVNEGCGSTFPADLQRAVVEHGADAGLAFDGDADRVIAVDASGQIVDGDQLIALCALDMHERGCLAGDTVVVTVMTNLGFRLAMQQHGIAVVETAVGDRYVLEALAGGGWSLGGEQSGHVIFRDVATTGDGVLTGLYLLDVMSRTGRPLADLAGVMTRLPQVLRNVRVGRRDAHLLARLEPDVQAARETLGEDGRVLVRTSGTEPLVRVMVEARTQAQAAAVAERLTDAVERLAG